mmetsp:Transcript_43540/g.52666  ORF Transcript_43540/g.52666 Transcript_43540/m.52666 type:complete len:238 (-) Transcript_43540:63-776(-)|eukprot:CAMPEP_0197853980 /NCGR_PEP_ID=MMETSP1438-20131217/23834_1 /TAXON_ID=1461541 /ORGANISM="Pterosperma sp., Strain CCMP1384" /LENGTH=237 /DNA_ID=CAMNT_0043468581 /DNA_START=57 /DNA_END=773 /DNA_ORIENTATION=+
MAQALCGQTQLIVRHTTSLRATNDFHIPILFSPHLQLGARKPKCRSYALNRSRKLPVRCAAKGSTHPSLTTTVTTTAQPTPPPATPSSSDIPPFLLPVVGVVLAGLIYWSRSGSKGSVDTLANRGVGLSKERNVDADQFYQGMMKNVNTTAIDELSSEQIEAARARRRQERKRSKDGDPDTDIKDIDLPQNHPWATAKQLSEEEEKERKAKVDMLSKSRRRRGRPSGEVNDDGIEMA